MNRGPIMITEVFGSQIKDGVRKLVFFDLTEEPTDKTFGDDIPTINLNFTVFPLSAIQELDKNYVFLRNAPATTTITIPILVKKAIYEQLSEESKLINSIP